MFVGRWFRYAFSAIAEVFHFPGNQREAMFKSYRRDQTVGDTKRAARSLALSIKNAPPFSNGLHHWKHKLRNQRGTVISINRSSCGPARTRGKKRCTPAQFADGHHS